MSRFSLSDTANNQAGKRALLLSILFCVCIPRALVAADTKTTVPKLSAAQVVEKHVAARGGLQAWKAVQTLSLSGKMDAGGGDSAARSAKIAREGLGAKRTHADVVAAAAKDAKDAKDKAGQQVQLPFKLEMARPQKSRLEIEFAGKTAVQVFDGKSGWKVRPYLNRNDVEPFTAVEAKTAAETAEMEGPLVDYAAKGTKVEVQAVEPVDGHNAYKLKLTLKSGTVQHVWIDAQSFLDVKVEGAPRKMDGRMHNVFTYQSDFRSVQGVMIPFVLETAVDGYRETHKTHVEKAALNQKLDDSSFAKPQA
jgi:outer membrane lipoprotein-sorting protein